jgi:hypothetical protein
MILADFGTLPAMGAFRLIYGWDEQPYLLLFIQPGLQEEVSIGSFYVAIQEQGRVLGVDGCQAEGQAGGYHRFARSALATCYGDNHTRGPW